MVIETGVQLSDKKQDAEASCLGLSLVGLSYTDSFVRISQPSAALLVCVSPFGDKTLCLCLGLNIQNF